MEMKVKKLTLVLFLISISTITYFIDGIFIKGSLPFNFAQTMNIICVFLIFLISFFGLLQRPIVINFLPLNIFIVLIIFISLIGFLFNSPIEVIPSFLRFFMYFLVALLTYNYILGNGLESFDRKLKQFTLILFFIAIFFGFYEVIFLNIRFMNGAFRFSGSFLGHPLANAMFLGITMILWLEYYVAPQRNIWGLIGLALLFYLFLNTHSRMPLAFLFLSFFAYYFLKEKRAVKFLKSLTLIAFIFIGLYLLITRTEISPRLKKLAVSENAFKDPSTNTRLLIIENSISGMTDAEKLFGIGIGGFNNFYAEITDKDGVAAHNNFLLFFVEGGIIGLLLFLLYQMALFFSLFRFIRKPPLIQGQRVNHRRLVYVSVFLFEICSFLLNNYYFFTSQTIVFLLLGLMMYLELNSFKKKNSNNINGS